MTFLDNDGQPPSFLNRSRRMQRTTEEIIGFLRGVLADGILADEEIMATCRMLLGRQQDVNDWIFQRLAARLTIALEDGVIDEDERADLVITIQEILGSEHQPVTERSTTAVPLTMPEPEIIFDKNIFVFTGKMVHGTRKQCQGEVIARGGRCQESITLQTNYLVLGTLGSQDWLYTTHGTKIQKAVEYGKLCNLAIVSERRWSDFLF